MDYLVKNNQRNNINQHNLAYHEDDIQRRMDDLAEGRMSNTGSQCTDTYRQ